MAERGTTTVNQSTNGVIRESFPFSDGQSLNAIRDIEYCINKIMERYNLPREGALHTIESLVKTGNFGLITRNGSARDNFF